MKGRRTSRPGESSREEKHLDLDRELRCKLPFVSELASGHDHDEKKLKEMKHCSRLRDNSSSRNLKKKQNKTTTMLMMMMTESRHHPEKTNKQGCCNRRRFQQQKKRKTMEDQHHAALETCRACPPPGAFSTWTSSPCGTCQTARREHHSCWPGSWAQTRW